jgi:hypothetical protein
MTYNELLEKLRKTMIEFKKARGKDPTLEELISFVEARTIKKKSVGLRSIKGIF